MEWAHSIWGQITSAVICMYYSALIDLPWEGKGNFFFMVTKKKKKFVQSVKSFFFQEDSYPYWIWMDSDVIYVIQETFYFEIPFYLMLGSYILAVDDFRLIFDYVLVLVSFQAEVCHSPFSDFNFKRKWLSRLYYSSSTHYFLHSIGGGRLCFCCNPYIQKKAPYSLIKKFIAILFDKKLNNALSWIVHYISI